MVAPPTDVTEATQEMTAATPTPMETEEVGAEEEGNPKKKVEMGIAAAKLPKDRPNDPPAASPPPPSTSSTSDDHSIPHEAPTSAVSSPKHKKEDDPVAPVPSKALLPTPPPPEPPRCLGLRAYDGGYYDVGSFFVFHPEARELPSAEVDLEEAKKDGGVDWSKARPFGYQFLGGLRVENGRDGHEATGGSSDEALQAFVQLERQANTIRRVLGCDLRPTPATLDANLDAGAGSTTVDENVARKGTGGAAAAAERVKGKTAGAVEDGEGNNVGDRNRAQCLALGNTEDNDSVRGLIRSGGSTWLGTFGLPPAPPGEENEVLDLWPKKVLRFTDSGQEGIVALEGASDGTGMLVASHTEASTSDSTSGSTYAGGDGDIEGPADAGACKAYTLVARALEEIRAFIPNLPEPKRSPSPVLPPAAPSGQRASNGNGVTHCGGLEINGSIRNDRGGGGRGSAHMSLRGRNLSVESEPPQSATAAAGASSSAGIRGRDRQEEENGAAELNVYNRSSGRKRPRPERGSPAPHPPSPLPEEQTGVIRETEGAADGDAGMGEVDGNGDGDGDNYMDDGDMDDGGGAGEMTVTAVRTSLLRNRADEGPNPDDGEWEGMVRRFIGYVEALSPGPTQEELSLMFAAALDPTLVRMRAANALLLRLAEESALPGSGVEEQDEEDYEDEEEDEDEEDLDGEEGDSGERRGVRSKGGRNKRFKVRLELDAVNGDDPPPEGVEALLKTVGVVRGAVEASARARACMVAAGDTLGGLQELKADYRRSLPPGPREPIQCIIAEEQARVRGYATAHEDIANRRVRDLVMRGRDVGDAYRAVEGEPGWSGVKNQVDAFLRRFAVYCGARLPGEGSDPGLLGLDIAVDKFQGGREREPRQ